VHRAEVDEREARDRGEQRPGHHADLGAERAARPQQREREEDRQQQVLVGRPEPRRDERLEILRDHRRDGEGAGERAPQDLEGRAVEAAEHPARQRAARAFREVVDEAEAQVEGAVRCLERDRQEQPRESAAQAGEARAHAA
jgi:hypothetical protein